MKTIYKFRFAITSLLLFCSVVYFSGCYSSYTTTIEPEQIPAEKECEFVNLKLKDSTKVDLKGKGAKYFDVFKGTQKVIAFNDVDKQTFVLKNDSIKVHPFVLKLYKLSEISNVRIEKQRLNWGETALVSIAIVVGALLIIFMIGLASVGGMNLGGKNLSGMHLSL